MKHYINSSIGNRIPYTLVSMAAILRDYADMSEWYKNDLHEKLTDIADSLYNVGITPDEFKTEYKELYDQYGKAYFDKVLDDMDALDGQLTSDDKVQELFDDYADRLDGVKASTKVSASDNPFYDKLSDYNKRIVDNRRKQFSPITFDVYNALLPYIGEYSSNTGWTGSCELMKVENNDTADGYLYKVIWDDGHDIDVFSWQINTNSRVGGDFTLMVLPAHGMPDFCDSEKDFYRAVRKVFGDGLKKIN